jgi:ribosomal protein S18 acetylase RimI-like enzyme
MGQKRTMQSLINRGCEHMVDAMNDEITYHILTTQNARQLQGSDVFDNSVDPEQLTAFLADPGHEMVFAAMGARIVGMASGTVLLHPDKQPAFFINEIGVSEDFQLRGIATSLCELLMKVARDRGCQGIWLATETDNIAARGLYRRLNARETSGIVVYDWDGAMDD